jgi:hypothetical protein
VRRPLAIRVRGLLLAARLNVRWPFVNQFFLIQLFKFLLKYSVLLITVSSDSYCASQNFGHMIYVTSAKLSIVRLHAVCCFASNW